MSHLPYYTTATPNDSTSTSYTTAFGGPKDHTILRSLIQISLSFIVLFIFGLPLRAFTIGTAYTEPCHESITLEAINFEQVEALTQDLVLPDSDEWLAVADTLPFVNSQNRSLETKYVLMSFLIGVRAPDVEEASALDLSALRQIHLANDKQAEHCLRKSEHDGEPGNYRAVESCRDAIAHSLEQARESFSREPIGQNVRRSLQLNFYGPVQTSVWAPAYWLGRAAHTVQDGFSHAIRSENLREIYHVLNYIEVPGEDYEEHRDGFAHSSNADDCTSTTEHRQLALEAQIATRALFDNFYDVVLEDSSRNIDNFLVTWFDVDTNCGLDNAMCDTPWQNHAEVHGNQLGCSNTKRGFSLIGTLLTMLYLFFKRQDSPRILIERHFTNHIKKTLK